MKRIRNEDIERIKCQMQVMADGGLVSGTEKERLVWIYTGRMYTGNLAASSDICTGNESDTDTVEGLLNKYKCASVAELEQLLGCKVPIGEYGDSSMKCLEQFAKEGPQYSTERPGMSKAQVCAVQELVGIGFSEAVSKAMICSDCLSLPLGEKIFKNAQLLKTFVDIDAFSADKPDPYSVASFLNYAPDKNASMAQVPQRYSFSEEEKQSYFSNPLRWTVDYDLRDQLGEALLDLFGDMERAERLMCRMYCSGHYLQPSAKIKEDIAALVSLNPDPEELRELVEENWMFLFSFYKDTSKTISILSDIFLNEYVWTIFSKGCMWLTAVVRDAGGEFFDQLPSALVRLKQEYDQYLRGK